MQLILITGISGSGKSVALNVLEDAGHYCIDNLPLRFIEDVAQSLKGDGHQSAAISIDARSGERITDFPRVTAALRQAGHDVTVLFLNSSSTTLVQRFSETRRRHPLSHRFGPGPGPGPGARAGDERPAGAPTLEECIALERDLMVPAQEIGHTIDTSELTPAQLRAWVLDLVNVERAGLILSFESFAFKHGVPLDADLVFDVRCLPNPHYEPALRALNGRDAPVIDYLRDIPLVARMIDDIDGFVARWLPSYQTDSRSYLTVAIGCTGGQHRSVYCVEQLAGRFRGSQEVLVRHRSLA
jgi:UPF0042 nucleotide-binding protein